MKTAQELLTKCHCGKNSGYDVLLQCGPRSRCALSAVRNLPIRTLTCLFRNIVTMHTICTTHAYKEGTTVHALYKHHYITYKSPKRYFFFFISYNHSRDCWPSCIQAVTMSARYSLRLEFTHTVTQWSD